MMRRVMGFCVLMVLTACASMPTGVEPGADQADWAVWRLAYQQAEQCSGRRGDFDRVHWTVVPGYSFERGGKQVIGFTDGHHIYLAGDWATTLWVARHEALHSLGFHAHDPTLFGVRCHATFETAADSVG